MKQYNVYQWIINGGFYNKKEVGKVQANNKEKALEKAREAWKLPHLYTKQEKQEQPKRSRKYENIMVAVINLKDSGEMIGFELDKLKGQARTTGATIKQLLERVENQKQTGTMILYIHNLKYYAPYILQEFEKRGYENKQEGGIDTFQTLTTGQNVYYVIKYETVNKKGLKVKIDIRDSNKKLPLSYEQIKKALNENNISNLEALRKALLNQYEQGMNHLTLASDSMATWIDMIGGYSVAGQILAPLTKEQDAFMRRSYFGGFLFCRAGTYKHGFSLDYNSAYPYIMKTAKLPYGEPIYFKGKYQKNEIYDLYVQKIIVDCELKDGYIPAIRDENGDYLINTDIPQELTLTSVDLNLLYKFYNIYAIEYVEGYMMKSVIGLFSEFVNKFYDMKKNGKTPGEVLTAKLILNMLYGKFGTTTRRTNKQVVSVNGEIKTQKIDIQEVEPRRVDLASFITAYVRERTINIAQKLNELGILLYCDTDSVHFEAEEIPQELSEYIDEKELGKLKIEAEFIEAKMIAPKCYAERIKGKGWNAKIAGLQNESCDKLQSREDFKHIFKAGAKVENKTLKVINGQTVKTASIYRIGGEA